MLRRLKDRDVRLIPPRDLDSKSGRSMLADASVAGEARAAARLIADTGKHRARS